MEPNANPIKEVLDELFTLLEALETQSSAVMKFLKDRKITTDKKFAPYLEQAGNASSVKWRAARVRMEYLLSPVQPVEKETKDKEKEPEKQQTWEAKKGNMDTDKGPAQNTNATEKDRVSAKAGGEEKNHQ